MRYLLLNIFFIFFFCLNGVLRAEDARLPHEHSPLETVRYTVDNVIRTNAELPGEENTERRREALRIIINPYFNFKEMAKRSLGLNWTKCSDVQRDEYTTIFSDLLARTYLQKIDSVTTNVVTYSGERITPPTATVKTLITHKGDKFPIDYKMMANSKGIWQVYDVIIENIGLVANYRNEFAGIIRREGFDGLLKRLRTKAESQQAS